MGATIENVVATVTWRPGFKPPWLTYRTEFCVLGKTECSYPADDNAVLKVHVAKTTHFCYLLLTSNDEKKNPFPWTIQNRYLTSKHAVRQQAATARVQRETKYSTVNPTGAWARRGRGDSRFHHTSALCKFMRKTCKFGGGVVVRIYCKI